MKLYFRNEFMEKKINKQKQKKRKKNKGKRNKDSSFNEVSMTNS